MRGRQVKLREAGEKGGEKVELYWGFISVNVSEVPSLMEMGRGMKCYSRGC